MVNVRMTTAGLVLSVLALASACGSSSDSSAGPGPTSAPSTSTGGSRSTSSPGTSTAVITIKDYQYSDPGTLTPGETVTVQNDDTVAHTVTADTGDAFDVNVPGHGTATFQAPTLAGSYAYHCDYHSTMHATLTVG